MARLAAVVALTAFALVFAPPAASRTTAGTAAGAGTAASAVGGGAASAAGGGAASAATEGSAASAASGAGSSSAAASVAAAAAAAGGNALPSFSTTPATAVVQPVLPVVQQSAYASVLVDTVSQFSQQYCTPASFSQPVANPANYTGPGMSITFLTGTCSIPTSSSLGSAGGSAASSAVTGRKLAQASAGNGGASTGGANAGNGSASTGGNSTSAGSPAPAPVPAAPAAANQISCTEPSIVITKTPAIYTSAYNSASEFTGEECMVSQTVGTPSAEVLYTFTDRQAVDTLALSSLVTSKLSQILQDGYQDLISSIVTSTNLNAAGVATTNSVTGGSAASAAVGGR